MCLAVSICAVGPVVLKTRGPFFLDRMAPSCQLDAVSVRPCERSRLSHTARLIELLRQSNFMAALVHGLFQIESARSFHFFKNSFAAIVHINIGNTTGYIKFPRKTHGQTRSPFILSYTKSVVFKDQKC